MSDRARRELERRRRSDPGDATLARRLAATLRREQPGGILQATFDSGWELDVWEELPDGRSQWIGTTPSYYGTGFPVPGDRPWWVALSRYPERLSELRALAAELTEKGVPGLALDRYAHDEHLRALGPMPRLERLLLAESGVTDAGLATLSDLPQLAHLDLSQCQGLRGPGLKRVASLPALRQLSLSLCPELTDLRGLLGSSVQHLSLAACTRLNSLEVLSSLPDLRSVEVSRIPILGEDFAVLYPRRGLRSVSAATTSISSLRGLSEGLEKLNVWNTELGSDELSRLPSLLPALQALKLGRTSRLTCASFTALAELPELRHLGVETRNVESCELGELRRLEELHLSSGSCPGDWLSELTHLHTLELYGTPSNDRLPARLRPLTELRVLSLGAGLSARGLRELAHSAPRLERLFLECGCEGSEARWVEGLASFETLQSLTIVSRCSCLDELAVSNVSKALPDCELNVW